MAKSRALRCHPRFLRNEFEGTGWHGFPQIRKQDPPTWDIRLIACTDTRAHDGPGNTRKGVHFFRNDVQFTGVYRNPENTWPKYSQYSFLLTPDFSLYADMPEWRQIESVGMSRWCGAWWQRHGAVVIPTVSWSTEKSFSYCFDAIERDAPVAVSMVGSRGEKRNFLRGFDAMRERLAPSAIICYGKPFAEMAGEVIAVPYERFVWEPR